MRSVRTALKFRMILDADVEGKLRELHRLDEPAVRGNATQGQAAFLQPGPVVIVELIAVTVPFRVP